MNASNVIPLTRVRLYEALRDYTSRGWFVFPVWSIVDGQCTCGRVCGTPGKHPVTSHGFKDATSDYTLAIKMFDKPNRPVNIAIATERSNLVVVDIDPRNGGDLLWESHRMPATLTAHTGGGGLHLYFKRARGMTHIKSRSGFERGIDIKADGGYVVVPPSVHTTGKMYTWDAGEADLAACPPWLHELIRTKPPSNEYDGPPLETSLGRAFAAAGMLGRSLGPNRITVVCPWEDEHSMGMTHDSSTVLFGGGRSGWFHCSHAHGGRKITQRDVWDAIPEEAKLVAGRDEEASTGIARSLGIEEQREEDESSVWKNSLRAGKEGGIANDAGNLVLMLSHDPDWAGCLAWDEMRYCPVWAKKPPSVPGLASPELGPVQDPDRVYIQHWFAKWRGVKFPKDCLVDAVAGAAKAQKFHAVRDFLKKLVWDGVPRIEQVMGASYVEQWMFRAWMISAVARAMTPGCQADSMLMLEGRQGIGKTTFVRMMSYSEDGGPHPDWYLPTIPQVSSKDAQVLVGGAWIVEIQELAAIQGAGNAAVKQFLSITTDKYRPPYGAYDITRPRQCVFVGTTNEDHYLDDPTGGRRYWPVRLPKQLDRQWILFHRDQLWAEATAAWKSGEQWHPGEEMSRMIAGVSGLRKTEDPWEFDVISIAQQGWDLSSPKTTEQIMTAMQIPIERRTKRDARRITDILYSSGWRRSNERGRRDLAGNLLPWGGWLPPGSQKE